mmetsp:Transcript_18983/g.27831  ORF Transcript_18983/g.27831 Transcript_18983/m.27831 type:complete len:85 (+) Transcript_18983:756-1010(+)
MSKSPPVNVSVIDDSEEDKSPDISFPSKPMTMTPENANRHAIQVRSGIEKKLPVVAADTRGTMTVVSCTKKAALSAGTVFKPIT